VSRHTGIATKKRGAPRKVAAARAVTEVALGVHVSTAGLDSPLPALDEAKERGCTAIQIFTRSPRQWAAKPLTPEVVEKFKATRAAIGLKTVVVHASYLINNAASDRTQRARSTRTLIDEVLRAGALGCEAVIVHPGSGVGPLARRRAREALLEAASAADGKTRLCVENVTPGGSKIGATLEEIGELVEGTSMGFCFDTCHAFAAGYPVHTDPAGVVGMIERLVGLERLVVVHLNDSLGGFGEGIDRHCMLGEGRIGADAFRRILANPVLRSRPLVMEVPGGLEDHRENVRRVRRWLRLGGPAEKKATASETAARRRTRTRASQGRPAAATSRNTRRRA
jgi:deoxyribonuclease-4